MRLRTERAGQKGVTQVLDGKTRILTPSLKVVVHRHWAWRCFSFRQTYFAVWFLGICDRVAVVRPFCDADSGCLGGPPLESKAKVSSTWSSRCGRGQWDIQHDVRTRGTNYSMPNFPTNVCCAIPSARPSGSLTDVALPVNPCDVNESLLTVRSRVFVGARPLLNCG